MPEKVVVLAPFHDELTEINDRMECIWAMSQALTEIRQVIARVRMSKKQKASLIAEVDHIFEHLAEETRVMCNDVKDRRN